MSRSLFSRNWHRVAQLKPRLRSHAEFHRSVFRGEIWFVVEDHATGAFQRLSAAAYRLVGMMNGHRSVNDIWTAAAEVLGDDLPTQDEVIHLLARLHNADLIEAEIPTDVSRVVARGERTDRKKRLMSVKNPLAIRIPLLDPDHFLAATMWIARPLTGPFGVILWAAVLLWGLSSVAMHWDEIAGNLSDSALTLGNLALLIVVYPIVKAFHELGHAYFVRRWGGEVHEIGVMLLVFMPVPYVDASASSAFRSKWQRAAVSFAGIAVELFLAALAAIIWPMLEPGLLRAAMTNVMILGGLSTLLFNGNPLLRFDGYYVLSDLIEVPNLGPRSNQHLTAALQRYILGLKDAVFPAMTPGESVWFSVYGTLSLIYRYLIMASIALFVASRFFEVGLLLAIWTLVLLLVVPITKAVWFVLTSPRLDGRRPRALVACVAALSVLGYALMVQPVPLRTVVEGVVTAPDESVVNAGAEGFIIEILAEPGQMIAAGAPILRITNPLLEQTVDILGRRIAEAELRLLQSLTSNPVETGTRTREIEILREELEIALDRLGRQVVTAPKQGRLLLPRREELLGQYVRRGDRLAWTVDEGDTRISAVVTQQEIDLVRRRIDGIAVRTASRPDVEFPAAFDIVDAEVTRRLPAASLGRPGGGRIALDPRMADGVTALDIVFVFQLEPSRSDLVGNLGERVHARFDHGHAPLGAQLWRRLRQIFLRDLNV